MKRFLGRFGRIGLIVGGVALAAAVILVSGVAIAQRTFGPHGMHRRMHAFIAGAVDAAKPDAAQRRAIDATRERVMNTLQGMRQSHHGEAREAIALFEADQLDGARVQALKSERIADMKQAGDAIVGALTEVHDVLRPEQRKAVADYIRANKPSKGPGFRSAMMKRFATSRVDDMLDEIDATDQQRTAIEAARAHVVAAFDENVANTEAQACERALALVQADRSDQRQVQAMRAEHQAKAEHIGDAVVQAIHDVHDALTPAQRKQVTDEIRTRMARAQ